jgi:hypothetical protein
MPLVNVGVRWVGSGDRLNTKNDFIVVMRTTPDRVVFDKTNPLDRVDLPAQILPKDLPLGVKLSVCGPSPYERQGWWAIVERLPNGTFRVE